MRSNNRLKNNADNVKLNINNTKTKSVNGRNSKDAALKLIKLCNEMSGKRNKDIKDNSNNDSGEWNLFTL